MNDELLLVCERTALSRVSKPCLDVFNLLFGGMEIALFKVSKV
jgi:hypothetical protein